MSRGRIRGDEMMEGRRSIGRVQEKGLPLYPKDSGYGTGCLDGRLASSLILIESPHTEPSGPSEGLKRAGIDFSLRHNPILDETSKMSRPKIQLPKLDASSNISVMARTWHQQQRLRELVDAKVAAGVSKLDQARGIGIALSSLITAYSGKDREPGRKTIRLMSVYYGVQQSELTDDPMAQIPAIDVDDSKKMSPAKRLIMRSVAQKISPEDVTDEDAERVWKAIDSLIEAGKIRPPK
jgi:hypothetical protein